MAEDDAGAEILRLQGIAVCRRFTEADGKAFEAAVEQRNGARQARRAAVVALRAVRL